MALREGQDTDVKKRRKITGKEKRKQFKKEKNAKGKKWKKWS